MDDYWHDGGFEKWIICLDWVGWRVMKNNDDDVEIATLSTTMN